MNHGLKVNGNVLEITLPEEVHIDKVIVNRQIFSQRMQVCKSCKYHDLEGHEEPCVSCEVGNSNYVAVEERTEERTETHACDCISRQDAISIANDLIISVSGYEQHNHAVNSYSAELMKLPSAEPEQKKGKWIVYKAPDKQHCGLVNCPFCGEDMIAEADEYNFCPNCGADMRGEQE